MPLATLIVNPAAGRAGKLTAQLPALETLLATRGYSFDLVSTTADEASATTLAVAAAKTSSLVLACGGDGTVHGVVQGLALAGVPPGIPMGVLPLGTHNALAASLDLPSNPLAALARLLTYTPRLIPLGRIVTEQQTRFFVTMAGCGPSGALAQALAAGSAGKSRLGRAAYPAHAARLFATRGWPRFHVEYRLPGSPWRSTEAAALLVSRVPSLGGFLARLTPGATLQAPLLQAWLVDAPAQLTLPAWFAASMLGLPCPWLRRLEVEELRCVPLGSSPVLVQADAEPLGALPCSLSLAPAALNLLMPQTISCAFSAQAPCLGVTQGSRPGLV